MLLDVVCITAGYGEAPVIENVSLSVEAGEIVAIIGPNGAGKSTVLRTLAGQLVPKSGTVRYAGENITRLGIADRGRRGLVFIPQGMNIFPSLTVHENLEIAGMLVDAAAERRKAVRAALDHYPALGRKRHNHARSLSGGERQLLALCRIRILKPRLVLLDEPSLGLAPKLVDEVLDTVRRLKAEGMTILLVEQNVREALDLADRGYVIQTGRIVGEGGGKELLASDKFRQAFLGI